MDPFLERHWQDVHSTFMVFAKQQLNRQLPSQLIARVEESLAVETAPPQRHLEIVEPSSGNRIVTVIELLSPVNKTMPAGRAAYRKKQSEYIQGMVNLVEIDLLRSGEFVLAMPEEDWPKEHQAPYKNLHPPCRTSLGGSGNWNSVAGEVTEHSDSTTLARSRRGLGIAADHRRLLPRRALLHDRL